MSSTPGENNELTGQKDQLNCTLSLDNWVTEELRRLAPHQSVFSLDAPRTVSRSLSMTKTVVATIANWVHAVEADQADPEKEAMMYKLFVA